MMNTRPSSIVEAFARNAERTPHKLCLQFEDEEWTYGGLREHAGTFAAIVVRDDPRSEKIEDFCREDLTSYKKPRQVVFVDALPRNALGKVLKYRVREGLIEPEE
jgi:acyl-CoA synthetase (AMP-forming)/AMP-acid ligase II